MRVPAIIVSPFAKKGYVDHTQYDTTSILRFITKRFALPILPGLRPGRSAGSQWQSTARRLDQRYRIHERIIRASKNFRDLLQTVSGVTANALSCEVRQSGKHRL